MTAATLFAVLILLFGRQLGLAHEKESKFHRGELTPQESVAENFAYSLNVSSCPGGFGLPHFRPTYFYIEHSRIHPAGLKRD